MMATQGMGETDSPDRSRCPWCSGSPSMTDYHDLEWGVPVTDDTLLFEFLILEGAQAGLSWSTVLNRREGYRKAYDGFDAGIVAEYGEKDVARLLADPGIIRNRRKVASSISNARCFLETVSEFGSFSRYMWRFVDGKPVQTSLSTMEEMPATSAISDVMSKDLRSRGFSFVGSTICYAHMQAVGMVNDHLTCCFRHDDIEGMGRAFSVP